MAFLKRWKTNWELKSLSFEELKNVILEVAVKQLDDVEKENLTLDANLSLDYDADSVDVVGMLLSLEEIFKDPTVQNETGQRIAVPTNELGQIILLEDIFEIMYEVLLGVEQNTEKGQPAIRANLDVLKKSKKMGELYN